jgi:hypothetical protein
MNFVEDIVQEGYCPPAETGDRPHHAEDTSEDIGKTLYRGLSNKTRYVADESEHLG